jgi:DNA-binding SARP family transcriptional activator/DNA-binding XRE family transcriptional regulator
MPTTTRNHAPVQDPSAPRGPAAGRDRPTAMGPLIRRHRAAAGLTQRQLADAARVSLGTLRDLEQGRTQRPRWGVVEGLATALGIAQVGELRQLWHRAGARPGGRPGIRVGVLGPLLVTRTGLPLALGPARQRAVLALLGLHQGDWLHREEIIDALWPERPPASAVAQVHVLISRLKALLDPARERGGRAGVIASSGPGYQLPAEAVHTDLTAFGWLAGQGGRAAARGDQAGACGYYEQALALWRGDVVADVWLLRRYPAVTELSCLRDDVVMGYAEAAAAAGRCARVLPYLRALCARQRFNERAHAHLMIALAAEGQQTAALGVFTALVRRLDGELGIWPSPILTRAHAEIRRRPLVPAR